MQIYNSSMEGIQGIQGTSEDAWYPHAIPHAGLWACGSHISHFRHRTAGHQTIIGHLFPWSRKKSEKLLVMSTQIPWRDMCRGRRRMDFFIVQLDGKLLPKQEEAKWWHDLCCPFCAACAQIDSSILFEILFFSARDHSCGNWCQPFHDH